ncbi:fec operon regulator FecR [Stieleria neptunia]|uniref:Fec operon regulator FecR n=1 Tax=Stieleria neptunia TaxID=2527979 RepID=A0A518I306_9BACT|nr:FecR family protein [Stieleria neptunia]QDV47483.1 fec operon regulator FecR [Stieleria neptunia]
MSDSDKPDDDVWDDLVERHLRGELNQREQEQLAGWLDSDASLREDFVRQATWDTELTEVVRSGGDRQSEMATLLAGKDDMQPRRTPAIMRALLAVAATTILALSYALVNQEAAPETIATDQSSGSVARITGLSGSLIWTGDRGELVRDIRVSTELAGGTIEGLSPDSWFELQFNDGSEVTTSGASMLTFSDDGQKRLRLREGRMSADVAPQPVGKPMVIQTRSATLTVLGTSFDVEAELPATAVSVREGTVRVTRTSDGKEIDVSANHRVVAAADQDFERRQIAGVIRNWESRIDQGPDETFGKWIAATETSPALLKAVAFVPEQNPNVVLYLLGLGVRSDEGAPIEVNEDSRFEIHGKIDVQTEIYFGIQVAYANGDFAGKFRAKCIVRRDNSGNFVARADLSDFGLDPSVAAYKDKLAPSPEGLFVNGVWSFTHSETPSGLRISEVALANPGNP